MVKQTFLNLPENKRQQIINIALEEFATKSYTKASLNNIVNRAGIAKGSMYQYFEDKKDLYTFVFNMALEERFSYINEHMDSNADFFQLFEKVSLLATEFDMKHPLLGKILLNVMEPFREDVLQEVHERSRQASLEFLERKLQEGQARGEVREDIDTKLAVNFMYALGEGLSNYLLQLLGVDVKGYLKNEKIARELTQEMISKKTGEVMKILRTGLQARE